MNLTCTQVDGNPNTALFEWFKGDVSKGETPAEGCLPVSAAVAFYETNGITKHDGGTYGCRGRNSAGWGQRDTTDIEVLCRYRTVSK